MRLIKKITHKYKTLLFLCFSSIFVGQVWSASGEVSLVADIYSGSAGGSPSDLTVFNNKLYFVASDAANGIELFVYDGTNTPSAVTNINPGAGHSYVEQLTVFNNKLYFTARDNAINPNQLYEYDGINAPTLVPNNGYRSTEYLTVFDNKLYFSAIDDVNGRELYVYDGTNTPSLVADIRSGHASSGPEHLTVFNNKLYFSAFNDANGRELYSYDSTNGANLVADIRSGVDSSYPEYFTEFNNKLYFKAHNGVNGYELYEYNGTNSPLLTADIRSGSSSSAPEHLTVFSNKLYFSADNGVTGIELYEYDGSNTPSLVANIRSGSNNSSPKQLTVLHDKLYFSANNGVNGVELYEYDGSNAPSLTKDIQSGVENGLPNHLTVFNDNLYFAAHDGIHGTELHVYTLFTPPIVTSPNTVQNTINNTFPISGTHIQNGVTVNLYADVDNDSFADNSTILASNLVSSNAWSLNATTTTLGAHNFVVIANSGSMNSIAVNIPTINKNNAPIISGTPATTVAEDATYSFTPTVTDDVGETTIFSITNKPSWATFSTSTGTLAGTPANTHVGTTSNIVITVTDSATATDSLASFNITVSNINDAPVISGTPATSVAEDTAYSFTPTVTDVDVGDTKTFSISNKPSWATFSTSTGALTGTPTQTHIGTTSGLVITVTDSATATDSLASFNLTVSNTNDAPVISGTPATSVAEDAAYSFTPTVTDVDVGDTKTFSITNQPSWATFSTSTGALTGTPTQTDIGTTSGIVITVTDSATATDSLASFNLTVSNTNDAPVISGTPATSAAEDTAYSFTPTVTDVDVGDTKTFSISNQPSWATFSTSTGALTGTPTQAHIGTTSGIVITVTDSATATDSLASFNLTVSNTNDAPVISGTPATSVAEDAAYSFTPTVTDVDAGDTKTFSITNQPSWATFSTSTGALTGTPTQANIGTTSGIVITVTDSATATDSLASFNLTVSNTNDAPVISGSPATSVAEDAAYSFTPTVTDVDVGDTKTFSITNQPSWATFSTSTGTLAGTPANTHVGTTSNIVITVTDSATATDSLASFNITVSNTNDAPVISGTPATSVAEDTAYSFTPTVTDVDTGDTTSFSIINKPSWATFSTSTGALTGTPTQADIGTTSNIVITVTDSGNATDSLAGFNITVSNTNDAPVISGTPATSVAEDAAYSFTPTVTDVDVGDTKTFSISNQPSWAIFSTSTGLLSGTPTQAHIGTTSGTVITVTDSATATDSLASFNITVSNTNDAPVISGNPTTSVAEDAAYSFTPTVTDVDVGDTKTFSITNQPSWATFSTSTGALTGTPTQTDIGTTSNIVITVADSANASVSLPAFALTVVNSNEAPIVEGQALMMEEDSPLTITLIGTDADDDELTYTLVTQPINGQVEQSTSNQWVYTPESNYNGTDTFTYKATDGEAGSEIATIELTIKPVNDTPIAQDDNIVLTYSKEGRYVLDVMSNDSDVDGDELNVMNANSTIGTTSIDGGQLIFEMQGVFEGEVELEYLLSDGSTNSHNDNASNKAKVTISFDSHIDALLPVITLPADITVNATALFTKVDLGVATAIDNEGKQIPVSLVDEEAHFAPGNNLVYWQAQDSNGFQRVATQRVAIHPLINIAKDRQSSEGEHHQVAVHLNGESPKYPVKVTYLVAGEADNNDHDLISGELVIDSGLVGYIEFNTFNDTEEEANETVVVTLNDSVNLGAKSVFTMSITEDNIAPKVTTGISQNNEQHPLIEKRLGDVVITSTVFDDNIDDSHSYRWSKLSGQLVDIDTDETTLTFDPTGLPLGQQIVSLIVTDNGDTPLSTKVFIYLDVVESLPVLTDIDSDGDLIPDNIEGYTDTDGDGIADYLDSDNNRCNVQPEAIGEGSLHLVETESSICLRRGVNTASDKSGSILLNVEEVIKDDDATNIGGIFDFVLTNLPVAGQSVSVVLPQRLPIPDNAIYRKLIPNNGWRDFTVDHQNYYSSAAGERGYCPSPNDSSWVLGLTAGHWCVQVTITDGGPNDDDGIENNHIVDPGGVAIGNNNNTLPVIVSEQVITTQNKPVTIDVLANDTDSDGDTLSIISATVNFGQVTIINEKLHYQPETNFFGISTINYIVSDGNGGTGFAEVSINVIENTAPVAVNDSASTNDRTAITINVLDNDTDVDNDELTLVSAKAEQGSVTISHNKLVYTPLVGFEGVDTVIYSIDDNNGSESQGQVAITIKAYETIIITNTSGGGGVGTIILFLGSIMLFIRQKSTIVTRKLVAKISLRSMPSTKSFSILALLSLSISLSLSLNSHAAETSTRYLFIKTELGQSKAKTSELDKQVPDGVITHIDDKATSWSIGLGAHITSDWSITLSYIDMGEGALTITGDTLIPSEYHQSVAQAAPVLVEGVALDGRYHFLQSELQGNKYAISVLLGVLIWNNNISSTYESLRIENKQFGQDMYYGIEATYQMDEAWGVNAGFKRYTLEVNDIDMAYVALTYQF